MRLLLPIVAVLMLTAGARAQEAIPTAATGSGAPAADYGGPIRIGHDKHDDSGPAPAIIGPCGGVKESDDGSPPKPDKSPHGQVWAGVGTHGYREAGGALCVPIGDNSALAIAVDAAHYGRR
jgi:hypothetical protein